MYQTGNCRQNDKRKNRGPTIWSCNGNFSDMAGKIITCTCIQACAVGVLFWTLCVGSVEEETSCMKLAIDVKLATQKVGLSILASGNLQLGGWLVWMIVHVSKHFGQVDGKWQTMWQLAFSLWL